MAQADNHKLRVSGYPKDGSKGWVTEEVASLDGPFQVVGTPVDFERLVGGVWVSTDAEGEGIGELASAPEKPTDSSPVR